MGGYGAGSPTKKPTLINSALFLQPKVIKQILKSLIFHHYKHDKVFSP